MGILDRITARRIRIAPSSEPYRVRMAGTAIRVIRGAREGCVITTNEPTRVDVGNTFEVVGGSWIVSPFDEFWIHFPENVTTPSELELEVWSCAALAVAPMDREAPLTRFGVAVRGEDLVMNESVNRIVIAIEPDVVLDGRHDLYELEEAPAGTFTATPKADFRGFDRPYTWLDGAVTADQDYTLRVYHVLNRDGTKRALVGTASATAANTITSSWDVSLSCGITPAWSSGRTPGPIALGPYGLELEIALDTLNPTTASFLFWLRGP